MDVCLVVKQESCFMGGVSSFSGQKQNHVGHPGETGALCCFLLLSWLAQTWLLLFPLKTFVAMCEHAPLCLCTCRLVAVFNR